MGGLADMDERRVRVYMGGVEFGPGFDDGEDVGGGHVGEGEVVFGGEGDDIALARGALCSKQSGREC